MEQLFIFGAGRDSRTKQLRALRGHQRRTFYIGEIHIQSGKRVPISVDWCRSYYPVIVKHIEDGNVLLHYAQDRFVDPQELQTLCFGTEEERAAYHASANTEAGSGEESAEAPGVESGSADAALSGTALVPQEETLAAVSEPPASEPVAVEGSVEEAAVEEVAAVSDFASELPLEAAPSAAPIELPEDWRRKTKHQLLGYAQQLGLDVSAMPSNKQLITMIERAVGG